tara:strand:- start:9391 stop:10998 length:1608 start_codon:yes stop_codon:yes gene_type:complete
MHNLGGANSLVEKWEKVLDGIENDYVRRTTATLLENQAKAILAEKLDEAAVTAASTTVGKLGTFQKFAFPLVRRVYPELIANNIVGVQPMSGPVSQIFYLGHSRHAENETQNVYSKYNLTYRGLTNQKIGSRVDDVAQSGDGTGQFHTTGANGGFNINSYDNLDLSSFLDVSAGSVSTTFGGKIAGWPDSSTITGWSVSGGERLTGTGIPEISFQIEQQAVVAKTRKMRALWTLEASQDLKAYHNLDLERELTELLSKELTLEIDRELLEDVRMLAYNPSGLERNMLTGGGGWYQDSMDNGNPNSFGETGGKDPNGNTGFAPTSFTYDHSGLPAAAGTGSNVFVCDLTNSAFTTGMAAQHMGHRYANLLAMLNMVSQDIYRTTHRGPGTVLVTSPIVAAMLESAAKLEGGVESSDRPTNMGATITYKGKFAGKYDLYVDPLWPEDEILVGYKGANAMDSGFVYCPYIPLQQLPTITDPESFQPRKGILTRYGKAAVQPASRFYRIIRLVGVNDNYLIDPFARVTHHGSNAISGYT